MALASCLWVGSASAALISENGDFGNTRGTAFNLNGSLTSDSNGANDNVYRVGDPTAIIRGQISSGSDVDFFSFSGMGGQQFYFDVDNGGVTNALTDSFLSLFDDTGTLIATGDDTSTGDGTGSGSGGGTLDPGSAQGADAFLGVYTLGGDPNTSRNYFLAITTFSNRPTAVGSATGTQQLLRPTDPFENQAGAGNGDDIGNFALTGATAGNDNFRNSTENLSGFGNYTLNVTMQVAPVPEPTTWAMMGMGVIGMVGIGWRRKRCGASAS